MNAPAWFAPLLSAAAVPALFLALLGTVFESRAAGPDPGRDRSAGTPEPVVLRVYTDYV